MLYPRLRRNEGYSHYTAESKNESKKKSRIRKVRKVAVQGIGSVLSEE